MQTTDDHSSACSSSLRPALWVTVAGQALIAFEFFYMIGPFALFFYSIYGPVLRWFQHSTEFSWLTEAFLPHVAGWTTSPVLMYTEDAGFVLAAAGLLGFIVCAVQVYSRKILRKGMVSGGLYRVIRHPQYASLMVCSAGMVLLWPRMIVLLSSLMMTAVYYALARLEERECLAAYEASYAEYLRTTAMFFPGLKLRSGRFRGHGRRGVVLAVLGFILLLSGAALGARYLRQYAIDSVLVSTVERSVFLAVTPTEQRTLDRIAEFAMSDSSFGSILQSDSLRGRACIGYVLPADMFISEIPMSPIQNEGTEHYLRRSTGEQHYRIVLTCVVLKHEQGQRGRQILADAVTTIPVAEAIVNAGSGAIRGVIRSNPASLNRELPMPVF